MADVRSAIAVLRLPPSAGIPEPNFAAAKSIITPAVRFCAGRGGIAGLGPPVIDGYPGLDPGGRPGQGAVKLFALLGLHPGPDVSVPAAASLAAIPPRQAEALLAELVGAHLLSEQSPGRYTAHDLLRAYAAEQVHRLVPDAARAAASHRILDHYLHTGHRALALMVPYLDPLDLVPAQPGVTLAELATADDALAWFTAEYPALLAAVHRAAAGDAGVPAWQLAWVLATYQLRRGLWAELEAACRASLAAARRAGDAAGQAHCLYRIGTSYARSGRIRQAGPVLEQALRQYEFIGAHASQAPIHGQLFLLAMQQQRPGEALRHALRAQELFRASANRTGQALVLSDIGYAHAMLGNFSQALGYCAQARAGLRELDHGPGEEAVWNSLGYIHHQMGDHQQAIACYRRVLDICDQTGDRYNQACVLDSLGDVHLSAGDAGAARWAWAQALRIIEDIDHSDASRIRVKLSSHVSLGPARACPVPATAGNSLAHAPGGATSPVSEPSRA